MIVVGMLVIAVLVAVASVRDEIEDMREQIDTLEELSKMKNCPFSEAGDASQVQWEPIGKAGGKQ